MNISLLVVLYADEQIVAFLLKCDKRLTREDGQSPAQLTGANQLKRFIALFLQALQRHLELHQAGNAALAPKRGADLPKGLLQTLLRSVHLRPGTDAGLGVARCHRPLKRLHQVWQLNPDFLYMLDADQILLVELLHLAPERKLRAQALHAEHQEKCQQRSKADNQFTAQRQSLEQLKQSVHTPPQFV
ncbi:hypothetical protein D3C81_1017350 [compost metagenome]